MSISPIVPRKLTEQEKADYVADANHCPYCKGNDISAGSFDGNSQEVCCSDCGQCWYDVYELISIECIDTEDAE